MEAILILAMLGVLYFFPTFIASHRRHRNESAIFLLNLFLGWTFLGWVVSIVWASTDNVVDR